MISNLTRFNKDLDELITTGRRLELAMKLEISPEEVEAQIKKEIGEKAAAFIEKLPSFNTQYQRWYSESLSLLRQLLPDRVADFVRHYEKPKNRKAITFENYRIEDYLQGLQIARTYSKEVIVGPDAALPHLKQQIAMVEATRARFESSLFEIRQLVQADLLDSELGAAEELAKHKFVRAAGALAGVVLERHLAQVCDDHQLVISKKHPTILDFYEALKAAAIIDVPQWRFLQHLGDIRNLCDHGRKPDPTADQVDDLIAGVKKITKTIY